jgi:methylamine dehydrogenase accessory protein MauD
LWLVSYILLWVLVLGLILLMVGLLQHMGVLQRQLAQLGAASPDPDPSALVVPEPSDDGPPPGTPLPEVTFETINGFGPLQLAHSNNGGETLLIILSPLCETCQGMVALLNSIVDDGVFHGTVGVFMKSDEQACQAFLSLFPLHLPVVCDSTRQIIMSFKVHNIPFGLLYDSRHTLKAKGVVGNRNELLTLLKDALVTLPSE